MPAPPQLFFGAVLDVSQSLVAPVSAFTSAYFSSVLTAERIKWAADDLYSQRVVHCPPELLTQCYIRGWIGEEDWQKGLGYSGIVTDSPNVRNHAWRYLAALGLQLPTIQTANALWASRLIDDDKWRRLVQDAGGNPDHWLQVAEMGLGIPTPAEAASMAWRQSITPGDMISLWDRAGLARGDKLREAIFREFSPLPPPASQIVYAVKDAWDLPTVQALGMDAEFPTGFGAMMSRQGQGYDLGAEPNAPPEWVGVTVPILEWRAHWRTIAPEQIYEIAALARPGNQRGLAPIPQGGGDQPGLTVDRLLKQADFPPTVRPYLRQRAMRRPTREDAVQMLAYSARKADGTQWSTADVREVLLDHDSDPLYLDAELSMIERKATEQRLRSPIGQTLSAITAALEAGAIGEQTALELLEPFTHSAQERQWIIRSVVIRVTTKHLRAVVSGIKRRRRLGEYDAAEARRALSVAGVDPVAAARIADELEWSVSVRYLWRTPQQLQSWLIDGVIGEPEVIARLKRLGMQDPDIERLIAIARQRRAERDLRDLERQRKQAANRQRQAEADRRRQAGELRRLYPVSRIQQWVEDGTMGEAEARGLLASVHGYQPVDVDRIIATWQLPGQAIGREVGEESIPGAGVRAGAERGGVPETITFGGQTFSAPPAEPTDLERRLAALRKWYTVPRIKRYVEDGDMDEEEARELLMEAYGIDHVTINREIATWKLPDQPIGREPP